MKLAACTYGLACLVGGGVALAIPPTPGSSMEGFHLEPKAALDDVFGDTSAYRKVIDRFIVIADQMQQRRDEFARVVQSVLLKLQPAAIVGEMANQASARSRSCPEGEIATLYAQALRAGQGYLRSGRELTRLFEQIRELDRLGETGGLTPDYRWRVKRVMMQYQTLLTDYREMKVAFHDQLADELRFAGCNLERMLAKADAGSLHYEAWPKPGEPGAPGVALPNGDKAPPSDPVAPPRVTSDQAIDHSAQPPPALPPTRSGIVIYIDNTRCRTPTRVSLDGKAVSVVAGSTRLALETTPGPHDLCLIPQQSSKSCGDAGTLRRSYLHEGWTIALRCE